MSTPPEGVTVFPKGNRMVFACHSDNAKALSLAGSFNDWRPTATPMTSDNGGQWSVALPLAPGRYEYKFLGDGEWCCEPGCTHKAFHCPQYTMNEFGTMNRVLEI